MVKIALPIVAVAALLAALPASASAAKKPVTCANAGKTIVKTKNARVYSQVVRSGHEKETRTYGCWLPTRDRLRLDLRCDHDDGSPQGDDACHQDHPYDVAVNGKYVAVTYCSFYNGEGGSTFSIVVRARLRPGARAEVVSIDNDADEQLGPFFKKLFISKRGGIAFSAVDVDHGDLQGQAIGYVPPDSKDNDAEEVALDHGPLLDADSLQIVGGELRWTNDGVVKTAPWK
jgi:hypothetical protein